MRYWSKRISLFLQFWKIALMARELEIEIQSHEQRVHDLQFSNDVSPQSKEKEYEFQRGFIEGINWCLKKSRQYSS